MRRVDNGMPRAELTDVVWHKSRYSNPEGNCVELALLPDGRVAVRDSRHLEGPALVCTGAEISAFVRGVKDGDFDGQLPGR